MRGSKEAPVSKRKLEDVERDMTFSVMLSTQLIALSPEEAKPDPGLLTKIDQLPNGAKPHDA